MGSRKVVSPRNADPARTAAPTFKAWLAAQVGRGDRVGGFARDAARDPCVLPSSHDAWRHHLRDADVGVVEAFEAAWKEFQRGIRS